MKTDSNPSAIPVPPVRRNRLLWIATSVLAALMAAIVATQAPALARQTAAAPGWRTYVDSAAGFSFDYPDDAGLQTSRDAGLPFDTVFINLPAGPLDDYQGIQIMVLPGELDRSQALRPGASARATVTSVNGYAAVRQARNPAAGLFDSRRVSVAGAGVTYQISLFGGGVGGDAEPSAESVAAYERVIQSFREIGRPGPLTYTAAQSGASAPALDPPVAEVFTYPLRSGAGRDYGVPAGITISGTRMEWLGYGVRNLDQWRIKCYSVDWARLIHTGEDWYRADYQTANTAGSPVYAVADGMVARYDPGVSYPGGVVLLRHRLPSGVDIYSMYGHVANVSVVQGQIVTRGQQIATVFNQNYTGRTPAKHPVWDSHIHFEMRYFLDAGNIYVPSTNAYGYNFPACTYAYPGRGYTYLVQPDAYPVTGTGYIAPSVFIAAHLAPAAPITPTPTVIPTASATPTPTVALTPTATLTPTQSPTLTPTPSATATLTPTLSPRPVITPSASPSPAPSPTATLVVTAGSVSYMPFVVGPGSIVITGTPAPVETCVDLLTNGDFEASASTALPWTGTANTTGVIYNVIPGGSANTTVDPLVTAARAHLGKRAARLGSATLSSYWNELLQTVTLPVSPTRVTLSFWRMVETSELATQLPYDRFSAGLETDQGTLLASPANFSNVDAKPGVWVQEAWNLPNPASRGGQAVWVTFKGALDGNRPTAMYIDDIQLTACHLEPPAPVR